MTWALGLSQSKGEPARMSICAGCFIHIFLRIYTVPFFIRTRNPWFRVMCNFNGFIHPFCMFHKQLCTVLYLFIKTWSSPSSESGNSEGWIRERRLCRSVFLIRSAGVMEHWSIVQDSAFVGGTKVSQNCYG